ncbi:uncharacterized protein LOC107266263 [Cephus cinctus]|uniref:Uncharacterized protein LOC107266263 n=1 Tax=Cephus cinctus TaxID=211228 RepID=A0AAJ7FHG1_CEPCN|nr:uncharacterized protein LOC107266263 [Cephus cinctus]
MVKSCSHKMTSRFRTTGIALLACSVFYIVNGQSCSNEEHQRCVSLADPLLKDPHLIFPDNIQDIDMVCRTWTSFVDCITRYIQKCFTEQRREQFNSAVQQPIASVHQMCSVSTYQTEYLKYASCIKATVTESEHCGNQYAALVDEVSRGEVAKTSLCCSHYHFRTCVISEARKRCDGSQSGGTAARFSRQVLDKALSFLQDQCQNYIPNSGDCPNYSTENSVLSVSPLGEGLENILGTRSRPYHRTMPTDTSYSGQPSDNYDSDSNSALPNGFRSTGRSLNLSPTKEPDREEVWSPATGLSISNVPMRTTANKMEGSMTPTKVGGDMEGEMIAQVESTATNFVHHDEQPAVVVTQRPATYGRGMSWTSPANEPTSEVPAWATSTWQGSDQIPVTDESWFSGLPAGSFGGNHIDEPNQQGLSKNGQVVLRSSVYILGIAISTFYLL